VDLPITNEKKYLYPKCLYGIDDYLADFNLSLVPKDERIKQGKEEIIAIKNGQDTEYPQIRVVVKGDAVESMKFFAMNGVKYYEIIVDKTAKISTISIPVELTEKFYTEAGTMTNTLKYEGINLK